VSAETTVSNYRAAVLHYAVREHQICEAFGALRAARIEPILLKGWSVARHYPAPITRPLGDIDLLVRGDELRLARRIVRGNIDWHVNDRLQPEFAARSQLVPLLATRVRVLCPEHSLRYVAIHMLRHGVWSPQWLQDVNVLINTRSADFDWDLSLGSDPVPAGWLKDALVLTRDLLGADLSGTPAANHTIPSWLVPAVHHAWRRQDPESNQPPESIWTSLAHPWRLPHAIVKRWPNPIAAAIHNRSALELGGPRRHLIVYMARLALKPLTGSRG
jgi:hypothetical protein